MPESFSYNGTVYTVTDLKVVNENNVFDSFSCRLNGPSSTVKSTIGHGGHLTASHEVLITDQDGDSIFAGFLEWVEQDGVDLILKGRDYKVLLLDERTPRDAEWINQTGSTIINALLGYSTKVVAGTIDYSDTISGTARFSHENILRAIATICAQNDKDFWVEMDYTADLTLGMTSSASSEFSSSNAASKTFDDETSTYWLTTNGDVVGGWIKIDFGLSNLKEITKITIHQRSSYGFNSFKLQGSNNDSDWTDVYSGTAVNNETVQTFTFSNVTEYRYYRVYCVSGYSAIYIGVYEIEMMEHTEVCHLHVGMRGSGGSVFPLTLPFTFASNVYRAGKEIEIAAETKTTNKVVNRQRVFGAGDGINQIQVCVPWIDINEVDSERSQGFDGSNADCTHAVATTSQGDVGVMEGKPYVDTGIVSTDIAIATAKAILDISAPVASVKTLDVDFLKYVTGDDIGDWIRVIDRKQGVDSTLRVKKIVRDIEKKNIRMEFYTPEEDIAGALARIERDSDLSNLNGIGATNLIEINFPDICDNTNPYEMWFEFPSEIEFLNRVKLTYIVDDYRAFSSTTGGGSSHTHTISVHAPFDTSDIGVVGVQTYSGHNYFVAKGDLSAIEANTGESAHTHDVDFTISKQAASLTDVAIWIDDGAGYVNKTTDIETAIGHTLSLTQETDIPVAPYISATAGIKKIKIVPTGSNNGECRITGLALIMFYLESK